MEDFLGFKLKAQPYIRRAVILSIAYCYHARLPRQERQQLVKAITDKWRAMQTLDAPVAPRGGQYGAYGGAYGGAYSWPAVKKPKCAWLKLDPSSFITTLEVCSNFVNNL